MTWTSVPIHPIPTTTCIALWSPCASPTALRPTSTVMIHPIRGLRPQVMSLRPRPSPRRPRPQRVEARRRAGACPLTSCTISSSTTAFPHPHFPSGMLSMSNSHSTHRKCVLGVPLDHQPHNGTQSGPRSRYAICRPPSWAV